MILLLRHSKLYLLSVEEAWNEAGASRTWRRPAARQRMVRPALEGGGVGAGCAPIHLLHLFSCLSTEAAVRAGESRRQMGRGSWVPRWNDPLNVMWLTWPIWAINQFVIWDICCFCQLKSEGLTDCDTVDQIPDRRPEARAREGGWRGR